MGIIKQKGLLSTWPKTMASLSYKTKEKSNPFKNTKEKVERPKYEWFH